MKLVPLAVIAIAAALVGCGSNPDENYTTDVKLTPEQKAHESELMAGQQAPGAAPERGGGGGPSALTVKGKGGK